MFTNIKRTIRRIKWFVQRGKRGYADYDVWDLWTYLSKVISKSLRDLADAPGYKCICGELFSENCSCEQKYPEMLREVAMAFEEVVQLDEHYELTENTEKLNKAFDLLKENWLDLWY